MDWKKEGKAKNHSRIEWKRSWKPCLKFKEQNWYAHIGIRKGMDTVNLPKPGKKYLNVAILACRYGVRRSNLQSSNESKERFGCFYSSSTFFKEFEQPQLIVNIFRAILLWMLHELTGQFKHSNDNAHQPMKFPIAKGRDWS